MLAANRIILFVKSPQAIANFYNEKFGFRIREASENGKWIDLDAGGFSIGLHSGGKLNKSTASPKIAFFSKNVEASRKELLASGVKIGTVMKFGALRFCNVKDPEGNRFLISNRK
jgi:predicted enzyme related to lactoylglutathione lyase